MTLTSARSGAPASSSATSPANGRPVVPISVKPAMLAAVVLLGVLALRLYRLDDASVWWDEAISAWTARKGLWDIAVYQAGAVHPPLHYWLLHVWGALAGDGEFALRLSSALLGVLAVAIVYRIGARFVSPRAGLIAATLLAVSRFHVWWSQEIRMYSLATVLALASLYWFLHVLRGRRGRVEIAYGVATVLLLYTLYLGILTVLAQNLAVLVSLVVGRRSQPGRLAVLLRWAGLQIAVAVLYVPWLYMMSRYAGERSPLEAPLDPWQFARIYATVLTLGVDVDVERYAWLVLMLGGFALCSILLLWLRRHHLPMGGTLALYLILPPPMIYLLSLPSLAFYTPATHARYFLLIVPAWYLLLALAVVEWWRFAPLLGPALAVALVVVAGYFTPGYFDGRFKLDDYQTLTATLRAYSRPGDVVVLNPDTDWPVFHYHYRGDLPWVGLPHAERMTAPEVASLLEPVWPRYDRVWLVSSVKALTYDPEGNVARWLDERGQKVLDNAYGEVRLTLYTRPAPSGLAAALVPKGQPERSVNALVGDSLRLVGFDAPLRRAGSGQVIYLTLWWQTQDRPAHSYGLRIALVGQSGQVVTEQRWPGLDASVPTASWAPATTYREEYRVPITAKVQTGDYRWLAQVLDDAGAVVGEASLGGLAVVQTRAPGGQVDRDIAHRIGARLGNSIELAGYDDHRPEDQDGRIVMEPGAELRLTLFWQALEPVPENYTVFVHLLGSVSNASRGNRIWGQQDSVPGNGDLPTTGWTPGEMVVDEYAVKLDADAPPGEYEIEIGMYERATGQRLPVAAADGHPEGDRIILGRVLVR